MNTFNDTRNKDSFNEDSQPGNGKGFGSRYMAEWRLEMFSLGNTYDDNDIDLVKTFKPDPKIAYGVVKFGILIWVAYTIVYAFLNTIDRRIWIGFLTHWVAIINFLYFLGSFLLLVTVPISQDEGVNKWTRMTWILYPVSLNLGLIASILFWALVYEPPLAYETVMLHGIFFMLVLFDGMILNRIPIRLKHLLWTELVSFVYLLWTLIHGLSPLGNPNLNCEDNPDTDDDALYDTLNWKKRPVPALILVFFVMGVAVPIVHHLLWFVSIFFQPRHYIAPKKVEKEHEVEAEEELDF